jgi:Ca2+-binding RTX toxin-like protein
MAIVIGKNKHGETLDSSDGVTNGTDTIVGNDGADTIYAGGGNDLIKGGGGADTIDGQSGRDGVTYEDSTVGVEVSLVTGKGKGGTAEGDKLTSIQDLYGSQFDDKLTGDGLDNKLSGLDGDDTLKGGGGSDILIGGAGNDVLEVDGIGDTVDGGEDTDTIILKSDKGLEINLDSGFIDENANGAGITFGGVNSWYWDGIGHQKPSQPHFPGDPVEVVNVENVIGSSYDDDIYGDDLANSLSGGNGHDVLAGRGGDDILSGGNGNDIIHGGTGADLLTGGLHYDTFVFFSPDDSRIVGGKPEDVITDFQQGQDKIDLSRIDFALNDLLSLDNQNIGGTNYSYVGIDENNNGVFDEGEFAIAVKVAAGTILTNDDFLI